jgi:F-type H+-transporting ATPase subunit delta
MSRAAIRYAKALLDAAHAKALSAQVGADMETVSESIAGSPELQQFLMSPTTTSETKESVLLEVFADTSDETKKLFRLLLDNKRFGLLPGIAMQYGRLLEELNGIERATVTTATPLDEETKAKVLSKILEFSNKKIVLENVIDPELIGGFILRVGDKQYNASVAGRLQALKRELHGA